MTTQNIVDIAVGSSDFNILVKALSAAGLVNTIQNSNDITVFAPSDAAFTGLASDLGYTGDTADEDAVFDFIAGALAGLDPNGDPIPLLTDILIYHVSPGAKTEADVNAASSISTLLNGASFAANGGELVDGDTNAANPSIVIPDIQASNGTIQVIDKVLLPIETPVGDPVTSLTAAEGSKTVFIADFDSKECVGTSTTLYTEDVWFAEGYANVDVELAIQWIGQHVDKLTVGTTIAADVSDFTSLLDITQIVDISAEDMALTQRGIQANGQTAQFQESTVSHITADFADYRYAQVDVHWDEHSATAEGFSLLNDQQSLNDFYKALVERDPLELTYIDSHGVLSCIKLNPNGAVERLDYPWTPIAFDLNGTGGIETTGSSTTKDHSWNGGALQNIDLDGDGKAETIEWMEGSGDGLLIDIDQVSEPTSGSVTVNGLALFGDQGGVYASGYDKLAALEDDNNDGTISGAELSNLAVWVDDGDARLEAGEIKTLAELNITEISTAMTTTADGRMVSDTTVGGTITETDIEGTGKVAYSIEGPDAQFFQIDAATGKLSFANGFTPDFENPQDAGGNNIYDVTVIRATTGLTGELCDPVRENVQITIEDRPDPISIEMCENDPVFYYDANTHECVYTEDVFFAAAPDACITGRYFVDTDSNHVEGQNDGAVTGATVRLIDAGTNQVVATTTTDVNGDYMFDVVQAGDYKVEFQKFDNPNLLVNSGFDQNTVDAGGFFQYGLDGVDGWSGTGRVIESNYFGFDTSNSGNALIGLTVHQELSQTVNVDEDGVYYLRLDAVQWISNEFGNYSVAINGQTAGSFASERGTQTDQVEIPEATGAVIPLQLSAGQNTISIQVEGDSFVAFDNIELYRFPVGLEGNSVDFVSKNAGIDDTIDSDVNADGCTDVFSVAKGDKIENVDAGIPGFDMDTLADDFRTDPLNVFLGAQGGGLTGDTGGGGFYSTNGYVVGSNGSSYVTSDGMTYMGSPTVVSGPSGGGGGGSTFQPTPTPVHPGPENAGGGNINVGNVGNIGGGGGGFGFLGGGTQSFFGGVLATAAAGGPLTPVALDLNGDGAIGVTGSSTVMGHLYNGGATVSFDWKGDGTLIHSEWFNGDGDGILINTDLIGPNNEVTGLSLYGDKLGTYTNGYEQLAAEEDTNGDGVVNGAELDNIALWVDDGDAVLEAGELRTLDSAGVKAISTEVTVEADGRMTSEAGVDLEATGEVSYSLEGSDAQFFVIDPANGQITYAAGFVPDFENPQDAGGDNVYDITIVRSVLNSAGDCIKEPVREHIQIKVTDKDEGPTTGSIQGTYFCDNNTNNIQDGPDKGEAGIRVQLLDAAGNFVAETTTDANGDYTFADVAPGDYKIMVDGSNIPGKVFVTKDAGDDAIDSDVDATGMSDVFSVAAGETKDIDAGVQDGPGSIQGTYFCDNNSNDVQDAGDKGEAGIRVQLLDAAGNFVAETTTDANGDYQFVNVAAGDYKIMVDPSNIPGKEFVAQDAGDDAIDSDVNATGMSEVFSVAPGETKDIDAGVKDAPLPVGSLSGTYFCDENDNDVQDGTDPGVQGVRVMLLDAAGNATGDVTFTDAGGDYSFGGLDAGTYGVKFDDPNGVLAGKELVAQDDPNGNGLGDDSDDSDAAGDTAQSTISGITVVAGADTPDNDAGARDIPAPTTGSISGRYFCDENGNAVDDGEAGVGGVTVFLRNLTTNENQTTTTAPDGSYSFTGLDAGRYFVRFDGQDDKPFVAAFQGGDPANDSDVARVFASGNGRTNTFDLAQGEDKTDIDAGVEAPQTGPGSIGGRYWIDINNNDVDDSEPGLEGVKVLLRNLDTNEQVTQFTDAMGDYCFDNLDAGRYQVRFYGVEGQDFVTAFAGNDPTIDSDVARVFGSGNGRSNTIDLAQGEVLKDIDAGVEPCLPPSPVQFVITDENTPTGTSDEAFSVDFVGTGFACYDDPVFTAVYCTDITLDTGAGLTQTGTLEVVGDNTFGTSMGVAGDQVDNLLNYIMNEDWEARGFTDAEVQGAVWGLFNNNFFVAAGAGEAADAEAILADAKANGLDYAVNAFGNVALLVTPEDAANQPFLIGLEYGCVCDPDSFGQGGGLI